MTLVVSAKDDMPPMGHFAMSAGSILIVEAGRRGMGRGATVTQWVETRDIAKHPIIQRPAPNSKELSTPAQDVNNAEARNPKL